MTNPTEGAMPPLPENAGWQPSIGQYVYTAEQLHAYAAPLIARVAELQAALSALIDYSTGHLCLHEETHRGGAIWEICDACGMKWADDEGGKPEWVEPKQILAARAAIAANKEQS